MNASLKNGLRRAAAAMVVAGALASPAQAADPDAVHDPFEGFNRAMFAVNEGLDKVVIKLRREGTEVDVLGLNEASATIVDRFGVHDKPDAIDKLMGH